MLDSCYGENHILNEFRDYWRKIEDETQSYQHSVIKDWNANAWKGFYKALNDAENIGLKQGSWSNSSFSTNLSSPTYTGLFLQNKQGCRVYVQLCKEMLNVKIKVSDKQQIKHLRNKWLKLVLAKELISELIIKKPIRLGNGVAMVVGTANNYISFENDKINIQKTIANLREIEQFLLELEVVNE